MTAKEEIRSPSEYIVGILVVFMKILIISSGLAGKYGGSAFSERSLAMTLGADSSVQVKVWLRRGRFNPIFCSKLSSISVYSWKSLFRVFLGSSTPLSSELLDSDIVHFNGHWQLDHTLLAIYCRIVGKPYFMQPRGMLWYGHRKVWLKRLYDRLFGRIAVNGAKSLIMLSHYEMNLLPRWVEKNKCFVLPNGIVSDLVPIPQPESKNKFLYLGRIEHRKNLLFLIQAYALLKKNNRTHFPLVLCGPSERNYDEVLHREIDRLGMNDFIKMRGPIYGEKKTQLIRSSVALIYPSTHEAFGRVPFEALCEGTLPLVSHSSGAAEYLQECSDRFIFEEGSVKSCADKMERSVQMPVEREEIEWAHEKFSWKKIGATLLQEYKHHLRSGVVSNPQLEPL